MGPIPVNGVIGGDHPRIDGRGKVTGEARYGADHRLNHVAYAYLVTADIALGRIRAIDERAARAVAGVFDVLTHGNVGKAVKPGKWVLDGGQMGTALAPLGSDRVHFSGQIVAVVLAATFETARFAASLLRPDYEAETPTATFGSPGLREGEPKGFGEAELETGDFAGAYAAAPVQVDAEYRTPANHQNPLELFQATCAWDGDDLTIWESTQNLRACQHGVAKQLGIRAKHVRVISPVIGGAFGSRGELGQATALIAFAAKRLGRPVKLVATRQQGFTLRTFRAETRHHLRLGADRTGKLTALSHESWELASRAEHFALTGSDVTARLYACPNIVTKVHSVDADRQTPGFMRAPPEVPYLFAMESAMDELACALDLDPLELRRRNDTMHEPIKGLPYTSRSLLQCIDAGAEAFGWGARNPRPGSMREGDELVGYGYATAFYPTNVGPADARVTLRPDGRVKVEIGAHEIGTGIRTVIAQTAADQLGVAVAAVEVAVGDSALPAAPLAAGSCSTASVCTVVAKACADLHDRVARAAVNAEESPLHGGDAARVVLRGGQVILGDTTEPLPAAAQRAGRGRDLVAKASNQPPGTTPLLAPLMMRRGLPVSAGGAHLKDRVQFAHGAQFVEVRVHRHTGQIRVPRLVGAFAAGRIMNPRTARSQLMGGQIWGLSSALHEATEIDRGLARYVNDNLGEYHVPVCADILQVESIMVPEEDTLVNPLGIKGVGELGTTGVNAATANALFHATGVRVRELPIRLDALLESAFLEG